MRNTPWLMQPYRADIRKLHELVCDIIMQFKLFPSNAPQNARYIEDEL
jgi:hypothetical protein